MVGEALYKNQARKRGALEFQVVEVAVHGRMGADIERDYLDRCSLLLYVPQEFFKLSLHHCRTADLTVQGRLVEQRAVPRWLGLVEQLLAAHACFHALVKNRWGNLGNDSFNYRPGVVLGLEQARQEIHGKARDAGRFLLHAD